MSLSQTFDPQNLALLANTHCEFCFATAKLWRHLASAASYSTKLHTVCSAACLTSVGRSSSVIRGLPLSGFLLQSTTFVVILSFLCLGCNSVTETRPEENKLYHSNADDRTLYTSTIWKYKYSSLYSEPQILNLEKTNDTKSKYLWNGKHYWYSAIIGTIRIYIISNEQIDHLTSQHINTSGCKLQTLYCTASAHIVIRC